MEKAGTHKSRYGDGEIKNSPCGRADGARGTNVYTYEPGQKIKLAFAEFIPHPGYFRVAFDDDGDDDFKDPVSIRPIDPSRPCPFNAADRCDGPDFYNSPAVLPGMDNLEPHLAKDSKKTYEFEITLPDVECDNCTLQLIQVMEDVIHGAYNTTPDHPADSQPPVADIYYQCVDLVLERGATTGGGDDGGSDDDDGCSIGRGRSGAAGAGLALGLGAAAILARRIGRRRRAS